MLSSSCWPPCETWRPANAKMWGRTVVIYINIFDAGGFENKHGIGILSKGKVQWTEDINERMITTMLKMNRQKIVQSSVYFPHREYADHHVEKMYRCIEHYTKWRKHTTIIAVELGPGIGTDRLNVWTAHTQRVEQTWREVEAWTDDPKFCRAQHNVQKRARTSELHFVQPVGKTSNWTRSDQHDFSITWTNIWSRPRWWLKQLRRSHHRPQQADF